MSDGDRGKPPRAGTSRVPPRDVPARSGSEVGRGWNTPLPFAQIGLLSFGELGRPRAAVRLLSMNPKVPGRIWHDPMQAAGRKHPAHGVLEVSGRPSVVFVTVASKDRQPWMADAQVQRSLCDVWSREALAWRVGYYLLMPDHLHFICSSADPRFTIERWIQFWKSQFRRSHPLNSWAFQRNAFHHRIRNQQEYDETWNYVRENPLRRGLVQRIEDWPFQGTLFPVHL